MFTNTLLFAIISKFCYCKEACLDFKGLTSHFTQGRLGRILRAAAVALPMSSMMGGCAVRMVTESGAEITGVDAGIVNFTQINGVNRDTIDANDITLLTQSTDSNVRCIGEKAKRYAAKGGNRVLTIRDELDQASARAGAPAQKKKMPVPASPRPVC